MEYLLLTIRGNLHGVLVYSVLGPKCTILCITAKNYSPQWRFRPSVPGFRPTFKISGKFQDIYHAGNDQARVQDFFLFVSSLFTSPTRKQKRFNCYGMGNPEQAGGPALTSIAVRIKRPCGVIHSDADAHLQYILSILPG